MKIQTSTDWKTAPISCTCEVMESMNPFRFCDKPTVKAYPAMHGGWMALCARHGLKHKEAYKTDDLISNGEKWK